MLVEERIVTCKTEDLTTEEVLLNLGPQHPSTHGVLRLVLTLRGETVVRCEPVVGYLHRGIEKIMENRPYLVGIRYVDQIDYLAQMFCEHAFVMAVEHLMGLEVPRRGQHLRVIADELHRIGSHLFWLGSYVNDLGAATPMLYCLRDREVICDHFEALGGSRFNVNYQRVGGVLHDLPAGWLQTLAPFLKQLVRNLEELDHLVTGNEIFIARTKNVGVVTKEAALGFGLCGPCLRGSGIPFDVRSAHPYEVYGELDFVPQTDLPGDLFARYRVRVAEMYESIRLVELAIAQLPAGPVRARVPHIIRPPKGEVYVSVESARGELGVHLISDGTQYPYRVKFRRPSFVNLQIVSELLKGHRMGDVIAILGSLDFVLPEVDA
jgi:NADH-quinone oxidoreductase subunit D